VTSPVTAVTVNGAALNLDGIEYSVSVSHGRADVLSQSGPSSAQIILYGPPNVPVQIADELRILAYSDSRFTGTITDARVEFLGPLGGVSRTTLIAIGELSKLGSRLVDVNFPHEMVDERVETILSATGLDYLNGATDTLELFAVSEDIPQPALELLDQLAQWSGGTFFDTPDGRIVFESYGVRGQTANPGNWAMQTQPWSALTREWDSFPTSLAALQIPPSSVVYAPTWSKSQQGLVNEVAVTHGNPPAVLTYTDSASVTAYGLRATEVTTGLRKTADANARGAAILLAQAQPLWGLGQVSVLVHTLDAPTRDLLMVAQSGTTISVSALPAEGPFTQFLGICEGWTEVYTPGQHILTLSLSDPRFSYQTVTWANVPSALVWEDVNPGLEWYNAVTADDLEAA
jgi:hypothetical protein